MPTAGLILDTLHLLEELLPPELDMVELCPHGIRRTSLPPIHHPDILPIAAENQRADKISPLDLYPQTPIPLEHLRGWMSELVVASHRDQCEDRADLL